MAQTATEQRVVTMIPQKIEPLSFHALATKARKRVAAYARVSTKDEEQITSYEAQVDYYTRYIKSKEEWEFVEVYTDEGISATSTKKRDGFNRMIEDALAGKIDLIIIKSVSRFARNTVDSLSTVRNLREKGVEVYFEKENIYTSDSKCELLLTIMSSLAQEESRSISENVTWGMRKRFADGKVSLPYKRFLGYKKGPDGLPAIVEEEAEIVRLIYRLFLYGKAPYAIAAILTDEGILTPSGKKGWRPNGVISILTNEKYKGDAILQKKYTVDFLTKKQKVNEGEVPQYYVANSHPAIIEPEIFDLVQYEMKRRKASGSFVSSVHPFSGKIFCGECGGMYGSDVWHSNSQYRRVVWRCNDKHKGAGKCRAPHLIEDNIKAAFLSAFNDVLGSRSEILAAYDEVLQVLTDTSALDTEISELESESDVVISLIRNLINENAKVALNQAEYEKKYTALSERLEKARNRLAEVEAMRHERIAKRTKIELFLKMLKRQGEIVTEFTDELWYTTVDTVKVYADQRLVFSFRNGSEITIKPEK